MRRWLVFATLTLFVCGCTSAGRPKGATQAKEEKQEGSKEFGVPNGEGSPFAQ
jgi:hypothetical protein